VFPLDWIADVVAPSSEDPNFELVQCICPRYMNVTDRQTDGRTTYDSNTALALRVSRGKKKEKKQQQNAVIDGRKICGTWQTRVTFQLYYHSQGEASDMFYIDDSVDEDRRLLVQTSATETDLNTSTMRQDDVKRYGAAAARYSTSSARP